MSVPSIWAIIPAAGIGQRMGSTIPKQYMPIDGTTVLEHTLNRLLAAKEVHGAVVALNDNDQYWKSITLSSRKPVLTVKGGEQRSDSVLNALMFLGKQEGFNENLDWVLVHDAARPCVNLSDITHLVQAVGKNEAGGLLAIPVSDTLKRQNPDQQVDETIDREGLWRAQTPQFFSYSILKEAMLRMVASKQDVTDESSAMEAIGYKPLLIQGSSSNIKITRPGDLRLAEMFLNEIEPNA